MVLVCGKTPAVSEDYLDSWLKRDDAQILYWGRVFERVRLHYEHYRAVLERNVSDPSFDRKAREVTQTRQVLQPGGTYRPKEGGPAPLGPQDVNHGTDRQRL